MTLLSGRRLLVADDSLTIQKVVELTFGDEGLQVTSVGDGEEAIRQLEESPPDIVLADVFMPGRNGYEVCEHVKRSERLRSIPVVLLVGTFESFDEAEARRVGADDVLTKPFQSIRGLVGKVGALLGGRPEEEERERGDLSITPRDAARPPREARAGEDAGSGVGEGIGGRRDAQTEVADAPIAAPPLSPSTARDEYQRRQVGERNTFADEGLTSNVEPPARSVFDDRAAMDDQMIEVSTVEDYDQPASLASRPAVTLIDAELAETNLLREAGRQETSLRDEQQGQVSAPQEREAVAAPQHSLAGGRQAVDQNGTDAYPTMESRMIHAERADEALLDLGEVETPAPAAEADDFILDLADDRIGAPLRAAQPAAFADDEQVIEVPAPIMPEATADESPQFDFGRTGDADDAQSYSTQELDEEGDGRIDQSVETTTLSPPFLEEAVFASPQLESAVAEPEVVGGAMSSPVAQGAGAAAMNLEQLPPEVIDMIARRAVEHLSERVVREIAWEVVPQLAELLIKRRLEEENL